MYDKITLHFRPSSTGIMVEAHDESGRCVASREVSARLMRHTVSDHLDRDAAIAFDSAIDAAVRREELRAVMAHDTLAHVSNQLAFIQRLNNGVEEMVV